MTPCPFLSPNTILRLTSTSILCLCAQRQPSAASPQPLRNTTSMGTLVQSKREPASSANIIQNLGAKDREALISCARFQLESSCRAFKDMTERKRSELGEIVEECIQQSASQTPNNTKLFTLLNILGITVQSIASAQPAYQALKTALIPLGIMLP